MNYYKRHIGDYAKKAGHLSVLEHGVYTLLLDAYYDREQAPTRSEAVRIARCRTDAELAALDAVLADFFHEIDGRFVQDRVEEEFVKAEAQARANQANGSLGGRPRKPKGTTKETHSVSVGNPSESEKNPNPLIHQSTKPEKQKTGSPKGSRLAKDWTLPADWGAWAISERPGVDLAREAAIFADHWHSTTKNAVKADWFAAWRNWIRRNLNGGNSNANTRKLSAAEQTRANALARERAERGQAHHGDGIAHAVGEDGRDLRPPLEHGLWD